MAAVLYYRKKLCIVEKSAIIFCCIYLMGRGFIVVFHCSVPMWCPNVVSQCGVQMWCSSVLSQCGVQVWRHSVVFQCGVTVLCHSVVSQCGVPVLCPRVVSQCGVSDFQQVDQSVNIVERGDLRFRITVIEPNIDTEDRNTEKMPTSSFSLVHWKIEIYSGLHFFFLFS